MTKEEQQQKFAHLVAVARAKGVWPLEADDFFLTEFVPPHHRKNMAFLMRLRREFGPYVLTIYEAVEWCQERQSVCDDDPDRIIQAAAAQFYDDIQIFAKKTREQIGESIASAWVRKDWPDFKRLKDFKRNALKSESSDVTAKPDHRAPRPS